MPVCFAIVIIVQDLSIYDGYPLADCATAHNRCVTNFRRYLVVIKLYFMHKAFYRFNCFSYQIMAILAACNIEAAYLKDECVLLTARWIRLRGDQFIVCSVLTFYSAYLFTLNWNIRKIIIFAASFCILKFIDNLEHILYFSIYTNHNPSET